MQFAMWLGAMKWYKFVLLWSVILHIHLVISAPIRWFFFCTHENELGLLDICLDKDLWVNRFSYRENISTVCHIGKSGATKSSLGTLLWTRLENNTVTGFQIGSSTLGITHGAWISDPILIVQKDQERAIYIIDVEGFGLNRIPEDVSLLMFLLHTCSHIIYTAKEKFFVSNIDLLARAIIHFNRLPHKVSPPSITFVLRTPPGIKDTLLLERLETYQNFPLVKSFFSNISAFSIPLLEDFDFKNFALNNYKRGMFLEFDQIIDKFLEETIGILSFSPSNQIIETSKQVLIGIHSENYIEGTPFESIKSSLEEIPALRKYRDCLFQCGSALCSLPKMKLFSDEIAAIESSSAVYCEKVAQFKELERIHRASFCEDFAMEYSRYYFAYYVDMLEYFSQDFHQRLWIHASIEARHKYDLCLKNNHVINYRNEANLESKLEHEHSLIVANAKQIEIFIEKSFKNWQKNISGLLRSMEFTKCLEVRYMVYHDLHQHSNCTFHKSVCNSLVDYYFDKSFNQLPCNLPSYSPPQIPFRPPKKRIVYFFGITMQ
jgi:hypothetical protein